MTDIPAPRPAPLRATHHCRHYSYDGGPRCAVGIDLSAPGAGKKCWPIHPDSVVEECDKRAEYTDEERAAYKEWAAERLIRTAVIVNEIPGDGDRRKRDGWGKTGEFSCPGCKTGTVKWSRSRVNGHIHAYCTTENCFSIIQ